MLVYSLPFIAALTGWFTNFLAVKMLFHPREERRFLFIKIQGIFPKRQKLLAEKLGKLVSEQLFSAEDIKKILQDPDLIVEVKVQLEMKIDDMLQNFLNNNPMMKMFISGSVLDNIKSSLTVEIEKAIPEVIESIGNRIDEKVDIEKIVYEKVTALSSNEIENLLYGIMAKEFKFIELVGAVLGFIIGCIQVVLVYIQG